MKEQRKNKREQRTIAKEIHSGIKGFNGPDDVFLFWLQDAKNVMRHRGICITFTRA